ncbi:hypothetical protein CLU79DRAFT_838609 [Phycomyces nitens]|nr:hypothetical protein CLU79DRAFT_838609 [Phycomyces nitens]
MTSILPRDILLYIGRILQPKDQLTCASVCREWREPFLDALWGVFNASEDNIKEICQMIDQDSPYKKNGHRVCALRSLYLESYTQIEFQALQYFFPNIEYFEYIQYRRGPSLNIEIVDWDIWKSLTHLCAPLGVSIKFFGYDHVFRHLSSLPNLVHLSIRRDFVTSREIDITWEQITALHVYLPDLKFLENDLALGSIPQIAMESIQTVDQVKSVTTVKYGSIRFSKLWILFFAQMYPNAHTLSLGFIWNGYTDESIFYEDQSTLPFEPFTFFPGLKNLNIAGLHCAPHTIVSIFIIFEKFNVPVKRLSVRALFNGSENRLKERIIASTRCFSKTLETLHLLMACNEEKLVGSKINIDLYSSLVELSISNHGQIIELDNIIDNCPALRSLMVTKAFLTFKPSRTNTVHPLSELGLESVSLKSYVMFFVSVRCKKLRILKMKTIRLFDDYFDESGHIVLDMPFSQLDKVAIGEMMCDGYHCHLYLIDQIFPPQLKWYHLCKGNINGETVVMERELSITDIGICKSYFNDFKNMVFYDRKLNGIPKGHNYDLLWAKDWKKDLQFGYITVRCKSVKDYYFYSHDYV